MSTFHTGRGIQHSMCRLLGIVSSQPVAYRLYLREAPRSLAQLSEQHPDGWGAAIFDPIQKWSIYKRAACAHRDESFHDLAVASRGVLLVAHIRQRTIGAASIDNTHPFMSGAWVFAHNGTIKDTTHLRRATSPERAAQIVGDTDSEQLFAFLLTRLDQAGLSGNAVCEATDRVIAEAVRELHTITDLGAYNFLLAAGDSIYVHRFGRSLFLLEQDAAHGSAVRHSNETGSDVDFPEACAAIFVASEAMTDENWREIPDGMLLRLKRGARVTYRSLVGAPQSLLASQATR